jgi:hypothetical protein
MDLSRLACKILERVRDFRSNFSWANEAPAEAKTKTKTKKPAAKKPAAKIYHRQPTRPQKKSAAKGKTTRGRATVKK